MDLASLGHWKGYDEAMQKAKTALMDDKAVILPTDTLYGLCVNALSGHAINHLLDLKGERDGKPISIMVSDLPMMKKYCEVPDKVAILLQQLLPGPTTVLLKRKASVKFPEAITKTKYIGVRIPHYIFTTKLVAELGFPLTATSANKSNCAPPHDLAGIDKGLANSVSLIVDGGPTHWRHGSTIIDLTLETPKIIREGADYARIRKIIEDYGSWKMP